MSASPARNNKRPAPSPFRDAVDTDYHTKQFGENGCPEYTDLGVGSNVLAISQLVRGGDPKSLAEEILTKGSSNEVADLVILLFTTRNTRGGKGEKKLAFELYFQLWKYYPITAKQLLPLFAHYGYWKDLLLISEMAHTMAPPISYAKDIVAAAIEVMVVQFKKDLASLARYKDELNKAEDNEKKLGAIRKRGPEISLLSKWLPREGSHFDKKTKFVSRFIAAMWPNHSSSAKAPPTDANDAWKSKGKATYRKTVAELTSFFELPEVLLAARRADEINFHKLASKATMRLTKAFLNEDKHGKRRSDDPKRIRLAQLFVDHLANKGRVKGGQLMPHEIVQKILSGGVTKPQEAVLDAQWKDLWKGVVEEVKIKAEKEGLDFNPTRMVPLSDVSSSMYGLPMHVAIALGIGISEITHPAFQNMVMTFESSPRWHRLNANDTIVQKVNSLQRAPWGGSTNFEAAYDLVLKVCVDHKLPREDMPTLIVFSDMQFNQAAGYRHNMETMHDTIKGKVASVAARLGWADNDPKPIVFWNLRNTGGHPVNKDTEGTVLLAGFSPSLLKLVMNGEALREEEVEVIQADGTVKTTKIRVTPEEVLRKMLDDGLYDPVREILASSSEGALFEYDMPMKSMGTSLKGEDGDEFELV